VLNTLTASELSQVKEYLTYTRHDCRSKVFAAQQEERDELNMQIVAQQKKRIRELERLESVIDRELTERKNQRRDGKNAAKDTNVHHEKAKKIS